MNPYDHLESEQTRIEKEKFYSWQETMFMLSWWLESNDIKKSKYIPDSV